MYRVLLAVPLLVLAALAAPAAAQDDAKKVKLRWYGQAMFQPETSNGKLVVFRPPPIPAFAPPRLTGDVPLGSHPHSGPNLNEQPKDKGRVFEGVKAAKGTK